MINLIEIINVGGDVLSLPLNDPSSGIIVKSVDGLGPVKAELVSSSFALQDGGLFQSSRRGFRNIVMVLDLDPRFGGGSVDALRNHLYSWFMAGRSLTFVVHKDDGFVAEAYGVVEDFVTPMFERDVRVAVSIVCHDPAFHGQETHMLAREGFSGTLVEHEIFYDGTLPGNVDMEISLGTGPGAGGFVMHHRTPTRPGTTLEFAAAVQNLDYIYVSTHPGKKFATRRRGGTDTSVLYGIAPQSVWTTLYPGLNYVGLTVSGMQTYYEVTWHDHYGGL